MPKPKQSKVFWFFFSKKNRFLFFAAKADQLPVNP
jgi:hypothetical protein